MRLDKVLAHWALALETPLTLLAERENRVYRIGTDDASPSVLRIHRKGYRSESEVRSELQWMAELHKQGLTVPTPVLTIDQSLLVNVDGVLVDRLSWLDGEPLGRSNEPLQLDNRRATFEKIGETMAMMHQISDHWQRPISFTRAHWDSDGLLGEQPLWGRFWENPQLTESQRELLLQAREKASNVLHAKADSLDYGLIHADMVRENILISKGGIQLLDFDDGGFGFRLFELATTLFKNRSEPDYVELEQALINGYQRIRPLDVTELSLFTLLRSFTYVGWIMPRIDESGSQERCNTFIATACELAEEYLAHEL